MRKTGVVNLPLHGGKAPAWLFGRMVKLAEATSAIIIDEYGAEEFLKRLSEPWWFQSFGCVLGFDWHSSGLTTTVCGALKEALKRKEQELGIFIAGGKGKTSMKTPLEIRNKGDMINLSDSDINNLIYSSKMSAKVDNTAVQDGYQLYQHSFFFDEKGRWCVVQQGMNPDNKYARRYHWLSSDFESFVEEPHSAICCDKTGKTLNMTSRDSREARNASVDLIKENPVKLEKNIDNVKRLRKDQSTLFNFSSFSMSSEHFPKISVDMKILMKAYEEQPSNYEELLAIKGVGPKTVRALALLSEIMYGKKASWKDPCKYAFAHGGKDGWPYPVNREVYDKSIEILKDAIKQAKLKNYEKLNALKRLNYSA